LKRQQENYTSVNQKFKTQNSNEEEKQKLWKQIYLAMLLDSSNIAIWRHSENFDTIFCVEVYQEKAKMQCKT
jgi:hypothetical protein